MKIKPLIIEIVGEAIKQDMFYAIDCLQGYSCADEYFFQHPTQDMRLLCNQKPDDKYVGIHNLDDCHILFFSRKEAERINKDVKEGKDTNDYECEAWMYWTNWNDGVERVVDYTTNLNKLIGIDKIMDKWEQQFVELKQTL